MLDGHHATWAAKRSNNVGSNKVGMLNPTLFDSLARALIYIIVIYFRENGMGIFRGTLIS